MKMPHLLYCIVILGFILGSHNGYMALWEDNDPTPVHVFPYRISSLPMQYHDALEQGIPIESYSALVELLKQYLS